MRERNRWGWGYKDAVIGADAARAAAPHVGALLGGFEPDGFEDPVPLEAVSLPPVRIEPPAALAEIADASDAARTSHSYGKSYLDTIRAFRGRYENVTDLVLRPREEADVEAAIEWAAGANVALIPYGGGTSVVGGVEPAVPSRFEGAATLDLGGLDRVLEVDDVSRAALIEAGASGPRLEEQLATEGMTMRFYQQSFELSSLGGWIATRAGGHFATGATHVDDLVESVRAITAAGAWESRRLPGSGAGPSPDRLLLGSEGILGVITRAWVRVQPKPGERAGRAVRFPSFAGGAEAVRAVIQSGQRPSNLRLLDPAEAE